MNLVALGVQPKAPAGLVPFNFRRIGGADVLLTNFLGDWLFVTDDEFSGLLKGRLDTGSALYDKLASNNFICDRMDEAKAVERVLHKKRFLDHGPSLHIAVVTLRSNEACAYRLVGRADMSAVQTDMAPGVGEKVVDLMLQSTSPSIRLEFRGGEPLANFPVIKHMVEHALARNRAYGKALEFSVLTNLSLMDDEKLRYLLDRKIRICTDIDGPEALHVKQRVLAEGNSYRIAAHWIERIHAAYADMGLDPSLYYVETRCMATREALEYPKQIVDTLKGLGCREPLLQPIDRFGIAGEVVDAVQYDPAAYAHFYRTAVDYILELNRGGEQILERNAAIFLSKILAGEEPNDLAIRSPSGSGLGVLAYNYDGRVFTSDEGRLLAEAGDDAFQIGDVQTSLYRNLMKHETVRALAMASIREVQPECKSCAFGPYCGIEPEHNYRMQGTIFGRMRESASCAVRKGIQDFLFEKLRESDTTTIEILRRWTTERERTHFMHASVAS